MFGRDTELISRRQAQPILLIEHDEAYARAISGMLDHARETVGGVVVVNSLAEAVVRMAHENFGVILLEFFLPDGAGLANIAVLQEAAPHIPVIVLGSADDEAIAVEAVHAGAQDYLVKSQINSNWLLRSIRYTIERHEADLALVRAEEKYHGIFDHLIEGIFVTSPEGHYLMANAALARIYGYASPDELMTSVTNIGERLYVIPGRRDEFKRLMEERDTVTGFESQIFRKDGSIIWISENCRAHRDAGGHLLHYEGTVDDITQRRVAEQELRNSESLYHSLVETMAQNVFRKDLAGRFTFANQQYCRHNHCKLEDILGKTDFDLFPKELAEKYQADDQRVMATGQVCETVEEHQPRGQDKLVVQVVKSPLYAPDGTINGLQGIFWDITAQKRAEEQIKQANIALATSREELSRKNRQLEDDLKMAREIQVALLPQQYPAVPRGAPAEASAFQFTHRYLPSGTVGGDFFSVTPISDLEVAVFICDVAGHGVRSALITAMIRALVEELRPQAHNPGLFMTKLNAELFALLKHAGSPVITTAFYLVANSATAEMQYSNAGHPKPLLLRRSEGLVQPLPTKSKNRQPALGLFETPTYETSELKLTPGDLVMLFTDGLFEVHSEQEELFTQERLTAIVAKQLQLPASPLFDAVLDEVRTFAAEGQFEDDVCLVGMEYTRPPNVAAG